MTPAGQWQALAGAFSGTLRAVPPYIFSKKRKNTIDKQESMV